MEGVWLPYGPCTPYGPTIRPVRLGQPLNISTSAIRVFSSGCFLYSTSVPKPRHIGARPKGVAFGLESLELKP